MKQGVFLKQAGIMVLLIFLMMMVVGAFLTTEIQDFYMDQFFSQMRRMIAENPDFLKSLQDAADEPEGYEAIGNNLDGMTGPLGIDQTSRKFYVLDSVTGVCLYSSSGEAEGDVITPTANILKAMTGESGTVRDSSASYMDVALRIEGPGGGSYIVYIRDDKYMVNEQVKTIRGFVFRAMFIGLCITVGLSMILAKALVTPIQSLTQAAERVKNGDFSQKPLNPSRDEIGILTETFNDMAVQLETTLVNLQKSEQMRREFVANVSHELRTPITSIRSYAETLETAGDLPPEIALNFLKVIVNESDRMTKIVHDLLTLSRFDSGGFELDVERFSFSRSVRDVYNAMLLEAQKRGQVFTVEFAGDIPNIRGDRARVEQVLINMVSNAIKYTPDGGSIYITAGTLPGNQDAADEMPPGKVWVKVRDTGVGIPAEDVPRVFERFYRVDKARSRESGGTGLGLSIAHEIVLRHNGSIELSSEQGEGTEITVILPIDGGNYTLPQEGVLFLLSEAEDRLTLSDLSAPASDTPSERGDGH